MYVVNLSLEKSNFWYQEANACRVTPITPKIQPQTTKEGATKESDVWKICLTTQTRHFQQIANDLVILTPKNCLKLTTS